MNKSSKPTNAQIASRLKHAARQKDVQDVFDYWDVEAMESAQPLSIDVDKSKVNKPIKKTLQRDKNNE